MIQRGHYDRNARKDAFPRLFAAKIDAYNIFHFFAGDNNAQSATVNWKTMEMGKDL